MILVSISRWGDYRVALNLITRVLLRRRGEERSSGHRSRGQRAESLEDAGGQLALETDKGAMSHGTQEASRSF